MDQCSSNINDCEQICTDQLPGYVCSCYDGFQLNNDNRTCDGTYIVYNHGNIDSLLQYYAIVTWFHGFYVSLNLLF